VGLGENSKFADGYDAIFGKKKVDAPAKKAPAKKAPAKAKKKPAKKK
jgi:hypothetical protein